MPRQLLSVVVALCVVMSVCGARDRRSGRHDRSRSDKYRSDKYRSDKYRRPDSGSPSSSVTVIKPLVGYNSVVERGKFFAATGKDSELNEKEFEANRSKEDGFVRKTDSWSAIRRYDKDSNGTIDWFEADEYRRSQYRRSSAGSSSEAASTTKTPAGTSSASERSKFFAAAGKDNELSETEFNAGRSKGTGFVRKTDNWAALLRHDRNSNKTIDWFEAAAYRRSQNKPPKQLQTTSGRTSASTSTEATYGGHRYKVIRKRISWEAAAQECKALGGHLVTIGSPGEMAFLRKLAGSSRLWVGATDRSREGHWVWVVGGSVPQGKTLWASGEPNGGKSCNYASITSRGLFDSSSPYASVSGMICELAK